MDDYDLQAALEASAALHRQQVECFPLDERYVSERAGLGESNDPDLPGSPADGQIIQLNTLNQFAQDVVPSINQFNTPAATCGYFAPANALLLARALREAPVRRREDLDRLVSLLQDGGRVLGEVRAVMAHLHRCRADWLSGHPADFRNERDRRGYMTNWVANYEISDYLRQCGERANGVSFFRYNQYPERAEATHEELLRLEEEKPFGGESTGDKASVKLEPGAARFIVERFWPDRRLGRTGEWVAGCENEVLVLDLNGHFAAAVVAVLDGVASLVIFNTTSGSYISGGAPAAAFDMAHHS